MQHILGTKIRKEREALGLSKSAFAKAVGLSSSFIYNLEADKRNPSIATLNKIAAFLKKDITDLISAKEKEKEPPFSILLRTEGLDDAATRILKKFRKYCDEYLRLESRTGRRLELAPLYSHISPERLADEERRRLGLGDEPIRDIFALCELNGCRILRLAIPEESKLSAAFIFLEEKEGAFTLINSGHSAGRQAFTAAHEYCHYLKDRYEGPVIDSPDVFIDEYVSLYHPREQFAQAFAARFLMPPSKVQEIIGKEFRARRLTFEHVIYLKRYFGVSYEAMMRTLKNLGFLSGAQFEDYFRRDPDSREREFFGNLDEEGAARGKRLKSRRPIFSDRFRLLTLEARKKA